MINNDAQEDKEDNIIPVATPVARPVTNQQSASSDGLGFLSSEEAASLLIENVQDYAMFLTDLSGRVVSWNLGVERILGYSEAEFVGLDVAVIFTPEDIEQRAPEQEMNTARSHASVTNERWHVRKDRSRLWAGGFLTFLRDDSGQPRGFAKIMRDRTAQKQMEEERERLVEELLHARREAEEARQGAEEAQRAAEENNRFKDRLIAIVSHEMRTPLTTIHAWLSLMHSSALPAETTSTAIGSLQRAVNSLTGLVNDLLDIERIRTGKMHLHLEPVNLLPVVAHAIQAIGLNGEEQSIRVSTRSISANCVVLGDSARLQQILLNLLSNAVKFTPKGGSVEVCVSSEGQAVELTVTDTGKGIPAEFLPHVFDEFRQADASDSRSHGGLGLGLHIVRELVELHGGTIQAESEGEGKGATFRFRFPRVTP